MKPKTCKACKHKFTPSKPLQYVCDYKCAISYANTLAEKNKRADALKSRRETKQKLQEIKPKAKWLSEAQDVFNKFIRLRDKDEPCISCGNPNPPITTGGQWDCGHYRTRGAQPALRFEELNAHKQCKKCNGGAGKYSHKNHTVSKAYKENLINKIGLEKVEWLEIEHEPKKYDIPDIIAIKKHYQAKVKELSQ
jgi:hypothetical protein